MTALEPQLTAVALLRPAGTVAVYLSESDAVATSEVTGRKKRLGGTALINVDKYPRVVFAVRFALKRALDLTKRPLPKGLGSYPRKMSR